MAEPTYLPEWATTSVVLPTAQTQNKIRPKLSLREIGYDKDEVPTAQELNWQLNNIHDWIVELKNRIDGVDSEPLLSLQDVYPIGSVYVNASNSANPFTFFNFGTWEAIGQGRVLIGAGTGTDSNSVSRVFNSGDTGGEYVHTLTVDEIPPHRHTVGPNSGTEGTEVVSEPWESHPGSGTLSSITGGGQSHNNIQPYIVVYMWKRTA